MKRLKTDVQVREITGYFLPPELRTPLRFGAETIRTLSCLRVRLRVEDREGKSAFGWGESPISVAWGWPSDRPYQDRERSLFQLAERIGAAVASLPDAGHPIELGTRLSGEVLPPVLRAETNLAIPELAGLICLAPFDIAIRDAFGRLHGIPTYASYSRDFMNRDLAGYLQPASGTDIAFQ